MLAIVIAAATFTSMDTEAYSKLSYKCQNPKDKLPSCLEEEDYRRRLRSLYTKEVCRINCTKFLCPSEEEEPKTDDDSFQAMCLNLDPSSVDDSVLGIESAAQRNAQSVVQNALSSAHSIVQNAQGNAMSAVAAAMKYGY